jgi:hypothetical protein
MGQIDDAALLVTVIAMRNNTHSSAFLVCDHLKYDLIPLTKIPKCDELIYRPEDRFRCCAASSPLAVRVRHAAPWSRALLPRLT